MSLKKSSRLILMAVSSIRTSGQEPSLTAFLFSVRFGWQILRATEERKRKTQTEGMKRGTTLLAISHKLSQEANDLVALKRTDE